MSIFKKKVDVITERITEEEIEKRAERLISEQFVGRVYSYPNYGVSPAPATTYAQSLLKDAIQKKDVQELINNFLENELLDEIVRKYISSELQKILKEDLIKEIVQKINEMQIEKK